MNADTFTAILRDRLFARSAPRAIAIALAAAALIPFAAGLAAAAGPEAPNDARNNVAVSCHCTDAVGQALCDSIRKEILASKTYRDDDNQKQYGLGVHLSCTDAWQGINADLTGHMSAVAITFTIYAPDLPGEVYEDSSVFRVGKDAIGEMTEKIVDAIGQLIKTNKKFFDHEHAAASAPAKPAAPSPSAVPTMHQVTPPP